MQKATITWVDGLQFVGESASGHGLVIDSSVDGGGHDAGPRPMELVLMGVMGCTAMDVISILKKKRQKVASLKISAKGEQADDAPRYFTHIELEYVATGDVEEEALRRAIELSETKYCSAMATLNGRTQFSSKYRVEQAETSVEPAVSSGG
jgi:putative redox protein